MWLATDAEDFEDYSPLIDKLKSTNTGLKLQALNKLLALQIIETKQFQWGELSRTLQQSLTSSNEEVFEATLKIHDRIIQFPKSCCDGYLSLLGGVFLLINNVRVLGTDSRVHRSLNLLLRSHSLVVQTLLYSGESLSDKVVTEFVKILNYDQSVSEILAALDSDCRWLRDFCYGSYVRQAFFKALLGSPSIYLSAIVQKIKEGNASRYNLNNFLHLLQYRSNWTYFPITLISSGEVITINGLMEFIVTQRKSDLVQSFLLELFTKNTDLLLNEHLVNLLFEPLTKNELDINLIEIIEIVAQSQQRSLLLLNCLNHRKLGKTVTRHLESLTVTDTMALQVSTLCRKFFLTLASDLNPKTLVAALGVFYRFCQSSGNKNESLSLLVFFYSHYGPQTIKNIGCDYNILSDLFTSYPVEDLKLVLNNIADHKSGYSFSNSHYNQIAKPYLDEIWSSQNEDDDVRSSKYEKFLLFLASIKLKTRVAIALLSYDNEDTLVGSEHSDDKSVDLGDLIEKSLNNTEEEEEALLGLWTMKVLAMNLDLLLYLHSNHRVQEKLERLREQCEIIDAHSSLRQSILESIESIGYCGDPCETKDFTHNKCPQSGDHNWITQARRSFKDKIMDNVKPIDLIEILTQVPKTCVFRKRDLSCWPSPDSVYYQLHPEDFFGISTMTNFGLQKGLLDEAKSHDDDLSLLIKRSRVFLGHQPKEFGRFDWFVGLVFLIARGDLEVSTDLLLNFTKTGVTGLVWSTFNEEFDEVVVENFYHSLDFVVEDNVPCCYQAIKLLGLSSGALINSWLSQCFFNYLQFEEICNFLVFAVIYPPECLIYYMAAICRHLEENIVEATYDKSLENITKVSDMRGFKLSDHLSFIETLMKKHRTIKLL